MLVAVPQPLPGGVSAALGSGRGWRSAALRRSVRDVYSRLNPSKDANRTPRKNELRPVLLAPRFAPCVKRFYPWSVTEPSTTRPPPGPDLATSHPTTPLLMGGVIFNARFDRARQRPGASKIPEQKHPQGQTPVSAIALSIRSLPVAAPAPGHDPPPPDDGLHARARENAESAGDAGSIHWRKTIGSRPLPRSRPPSTPGPDRRRRDQWRHLKPLPIGALCTIRRDLNW